jgi:GMP synthase-like glutamine amidotransferase
VPPAQIFIDAIGADRRKLLLLIVIVAQLFCGMSSVTANSRMIYAFSRDGALPGSALAQVNPGRGRPPTRSGWRPVGALILGLPYLWNSTGLRRGDLDRGHRPVHRLRAADVPAAAAGRELPARALAPGPVELGRSASSRSSGSCSSPCCSCCPTTVPITVDNFNYTVVVDEPLDLTEIALVRAAVDEGVPVFGICRGQQVINVALGGSLVQHIDGHDNHGHPRDLLAHSIDVVPGSELSKVTPGEHVMVNSLHHQSVKEVAPGLHATAHSSDGVVEGIESSDGMIVAVQCHPEELLGQEGWAMALFRSFVDRVTEHNHNGNGAIATDASKEGS